MITKLDLQSLREQIQDDVTCILDGCNEQMVDAICEAIVKRFKPVVDTFDIEPTIWANVDSSDGRCECCGQPLQDEVCVNTDCDY